MQIFSFHNGKTTKWEIPRSDNDYALELQQALCGR